MKSKTAEQLDINLKFGIGSFGELESKIISNCQKNMYKMESQSLCLIKLVLDNRLTFPSCAQFVSIVKSSITRHQNSCRSHLYFLFT
jgi:hypothetical protein